MDKVNLETIVTGGQVWYYFTVTDSIGDLISGAAYDFDGDGRVDEYSNVQDYYNAAELDKIEAELHKQADAALKELKKGLKHSRSQSYANLEERVESGIWSDRCHIVSYQYGEQAHLLAAAPEQAQSSFPITYLRFVDASLGCDADSRGGRASDDSVVDGIMTYLVAETAGGVRIELSDVSDWSGPTLYESAYLLRHFDVRDFTLPLVGETKVTPSQRPLLESIPNPLDFK